MVIRDMLSFYLERNSKDTGREWVITGYDDEARENSRETFYELYKARMRLYDLEDEGYFCKDMTR